MKRLVYFIAAAIASVGLASCEKALEPLNPTTKTQTVTIASGDSVSDLISLNDVRGNKITAAYKCNAIEDYKVELEMSSDCSSCYYKITAPDYILESASFDIDITFTDSANSRVASIKITCKPEVVDGLVVFTESANSFVVAPDAVAVFPTCKGNSNEKVKAASYKVLWQDTAEINANKIVDLGGSTLVSFKNSPEGNAVVAALDASNNVLWSWHFWVVEDTPKDVTVGGYTFMDRNIGALNLDEKSELSVGVIYQYGRKDPFPSIKYTEYKLRPIVDAGNTNVDITIVKNEAEDNLANSIANPTNYYNNVYVSGAKHGYSWITTDVTVYGAEKFKALWQNDGKKSMYDPCPAGYVVAPKAAWEAVKTASAENTQELWDSAYETFDSSSIGTNEKYAAGNRKKVQFRGCVYSGLRLTVAGEVNSNSTAFNFANCVGKALPTAVVWCADVDPDFENKVNASYFRGCAVKVNTTGNGNYDDVSAIKVNALNTTAKYTLNYALPVRCIKEK